MRAIKFCLAILALSIAAQSHAKEIVVYTVAHLRVACLIAAAGDVIQIPSITLTMDNAPLILPNNVVIRGTGQVRQRSMSSGAMGKAQTRWLDTSAAPGN